MEVSKNSKIWIYQSNRQFTADEEAFVDNWLKSFTKQWEAHGRKLNAFSEIRYSRFIILAVDEGQAEASGCSIDKSVSLMKQIEQELSISLFDRFNIAWKDAAGVHSGSREEFEQKIISGEITENTIVFNNLVQTLGELEEKWEVPFKESWHATVFGSLIKAELNGI